MKLALALGGGAGLGWAHIGVLNALQARGVEIAAVSGTSIGAIAAVCLAARRLHVLEDLARSANMREIVRYLDVDPRRGSMLGGRTVQNRLRLHFGHARFEDLFIPTAVVAADLVAGAEVVIRRGPVVEALRASIAIPGVFPPVRRDGMILVDGGVVAPVPVRAARLLSDAPVLAVNLQGDYRRRAERELPLHVRVMTPFRVGRAGLSLLMNRLGELSLAANPADLVIEPAIGHVDVRNFMRAHDLIDRGAESVAENWPAIAALIAKGPVASKPARP